MKVCRSDYGYRSAQRGITRSRRNGAWDLRRGPRRQTIERERWMEAFLNHQRAMGARML
jgi:hypothetical protein